MKILKVFIALTLIFALVGCGAPAEVENSITAPAVTGELEFSVLKVGQADAIIMKTENYSVVIDCGEEDDGGEVLEKLSGMGIDKVDFLFITHFDKDHVGGAAEVISNTEVMEVITPHYESGNDEYIEFKDAVPEQRWLKLTEDMIFTLDDVLFEVYPPKKASYAESDNNYSLAISVTHGDNRFLFTGDAEAIRLTEIMYDAKGEFDFLKVPHHGKYNSNTKKFIEAVKPAYAVVTCSDKNPADERTVGALDNFGCETYYTLNGDVGVISDGSEIVITQ